MIIIVTENTVEFLSVILIPTSIFDYKYQDAENQPTAIGWKERWKDGQLFKVKEGKLVGQMSEADFDLVISVNLKGVFNCAQAVAPIYDQTGQRGHH